MKQTGLVILMTAILFPCFGSENKEALRGETDIVQATGIAIPAPGKTLTELRREAISDALKNAVRLSCSTLDMNLQYENMRIKQRQLSIQSSGRAELVSVLRSGLIQTPSLSYYSVKIEALAMSDNLQQKKVDALSREESPVTIELQVTSTKARPLAETIENALRDKLPKKVNTQWVSHPDTGARISLECTIEPTPGNGHVISWNILNHPEHASAKNFTTSHTIGNRFIAPHEDYNDIITDLTDRLAVETTRLIRP